MKPLERRENLADLSRNLSIGGHYAALGVIISSAAPIFRRCSSRS